MPLLAIQVESTRWPWAELHPKTGFLLIALTEAMLGLELQQEADFSQDDQCALKAKTQENLANKN